MDRNNVIKQAGIENVRQDIRNYYKGILLVVLYIVVMDVLFRKMCPMVLVTGMPCPACGLTRAGWYVITLQWAKAWQMNPLIFPIGIAFAYAIFCRYIRGIKIYGGPLIITIIAILLIGFYLYRMVTCFSFETHHDSPMAYWKHNLLRYLYQMACQ